MNELASARPVGSRSPVTRILQATLQLALNFALPPLCPSCREPLSEGTGLCAPCWSKLSLIEPPYCARLGIPFVYDPGPNLLSMEAIAKYSDRLDVAPMLARWMARAGRELLAGADALVPVPLHWRRQWSRRFNQSAVLATEISTHSGVAVLHRGLKRVRATSQQVGRSKAERAENVQGAFRVPDASKADVYGRHLILVDDVLTSGATVDSCARALLRAGAANIDVLVFARVVAPTRTPI
jgi:ComF family protein